MRPVSTHWPATIGASHKVSLSLRVVDPDGNETELNSEAGGVTQGSVTLDGKADIRGSATLTVVTPRDLVPIDPSSLLAPYVNEVWVERGYETPDGLVERVRLGKFRIYDSDVQDTGDNLTISLTAYDRSKRFAEATIEETYNIAEGTNWADAILGLLQNVDPDVETDFPALTPTTPIITPAEGDNVWEWVTLLAKFIGMIIYFDGDGICVMKPYAPGSSVATIGEADNPDRVPARLLDVSNSWSRQGAVNRVVVIGSDPVTDAIYRAEVKDENKLSPTYYYGDFGKITFNYDSGLVQSQTQADDSAATILAQKLGTTQQVNFGSIVDPALEPNDVVTIVRSRLGLQAELILDSLTIPLDSSSPMTGTCRATQVIE